MLEEHGLSDRKLKILHAIIQTYLESGEPVGSRTISKYTDLNLSSATIRNEMADLEELGYIIQPHTSAGRIPSDKGYRLYVDMLMQEKEQELKAAGCFVDCAYETFHTMDAEHKQLGGMHLCLTLSRQSPLGYMEKCSREWIGYGVRDGKIVKDDTTPDYMFSDAYLKKVITHSTVEAQQLGVFLADLYEEYHELPDDAD